MHKEVVRLFLGTPMRKGTSLFHFLCLFWIFDAAPAAVVDRLRGGYSPFQPLRSSNAWAWGRGALWGDWSGPRITASSRWGTRLSLIHI